MATDRDPLALQPASFLELEGLYELWRAAPAPRPEIVMLNRPLAAELGLDIDELQSPAGAGALAGQGLRPDIATLAQAYAGHQFGGFSSSLGDGRALLLGELVDGDGRRRELHLKGSGPTPFSHGGDGRAALAPMLREYLMGEAMHALGIPTTRALAVVTTGERVVRETELPGAVLARVAASHLRVGTFQYASVHGDAALLARLADHAITRHAPSAAEADQPYVALFEAVIEAQASLVARWMLVGFVHGVMNTDNTTISGETIDYGPCAWMDSYDPATVFSSIDHGGRYAFGNQPPIVHWNLARLGEALLPLLGADLDAAVDAANSVLRTFPGRYELHWLDGMRAKLGLAGADPDDGVLIQDLLDLLAAQHVDFTRIMRSLSGAAVGDATETRALFEDPAGFDLWAARWRRRRAADARRAESVAAAMDRVNPVYVPRNHLVEAALTAAAEGDRAPFDELLDVLARPFDARARYGAYALPPARRDTRYVTYCGT